MSKKRYRIENSCPQCGCSEITVLSPEEIKKRFGDVPNVELKCSECAARYTKKTEDVCPEWAADCKS